MKIAVIGTLDTKGDETGFLADTLARLGHEPVVIDPGILGTPALKADVTRQEIAQAGGESLESLIARKDKAHAQSVMIDGLIRVVTALHDRGELAGVVAVGGAQGTALATAAMRALPVGVPKVMLSTVACGLTTFGPYVGNKDICMFHSVADISGLNRVTYRLLAQAAHAVAAMASVPPVSASEKELVAITQAGITTPGVMAVKERLERLGFEVIAFHCNGIGSQAMEEMVSDGVIQGVIDFSPHDVTDMLYGGLMPGVPDRMLAIAKAGVPFVVVPGCTDIRLYGTGPDLPAELRQRACVQHTPTHTHVRTSAEEMAGVAHFIAELLNAGRGPRAALVPLRGFSMLNRAGGPLYDEAANMAYVETLRRELSPDVKLVEVDAHVNDAAFAGVTVDTFLKLRAEAKRPAPEAV
ncbi:MAG: Tm-1-like ATP-binding domain-containing protein [Nitrososphaerales archaeon]